MDFEIVSVSSQSQNNPASNLLKSNSLKKWETDGVQTNATLMIKFQTQIINSIKVKGK